MPKGKAFSIDEVLMGLLIIGSLDVVEALLEPTGLGIALIPPEIGVALLTTFWFMYKGGSRIETRIIFILLGSVAELAPLIEVLPIRTVMFLVSVHLTNKAHERDAEDEQRGAGGQIEGGEEES